MAWGKGPRRVRTSGGSKLYGQPIGTIITADMIARAKRGAGVAQDARERLGMTNRRKGKRPVKGVRSDEVRRVANGPKARKARTAKPKAGLPEGHRFAADPLDERKGRYDEAVDNAQDMDTLNQVFDVLEADTELDDERFEAILVSMEEKAKALGEEEDYVEPDDSPQAKPDTKPVDRKLEDAKKAPSPAHKKKLLDLLGNSNDRKQTADIKRRAEAWHKAGYLDDKMLAAVQTKVAQKEKGLDTWEGQTKDVYAQSVARLLRRDDLEGADLHYARSVVKNLSEDGVLEEHEQKWLEGLIADAEAKVPEDKRSSVFTPGAVAIEGDPLGGATHDERNALINPKELSDEHATRMAELRETADTSPAGLALANGQKIEDLEDPDGLEQYMRAHPDRFETNDISGGASGSQVFSVHDKEHDTTYFFKRASNNGNVGATGDGINEVLSGKLGHEAFPDLFLDADFAERPEYGGNPLIRMTHIDEKAKADGSDMVFYDSTVRDYGAALAEPQDAVALHVFDFLTNQNDRHDGNIGWYETPKGVRLVPTDNGNAFNAYNAYLLDANIEALDIDSVTAPETFNYQRWADHYVVNDTDEFFNKEKNVVFDVLQSYEGDEKKLRADIKKVVARFQKTDIDAIMADLRRRFPNMDDYESQHMEAAARIWKARVSFLDEFEEQFIDLAKGL